MRDHAGSQPVPYPAAEDENAANTVPVRTVRGTRRTRDQQRDVERRHVRRAVGW